MSRHSKVPIIGITCSMEYTDKNRKYPTAYAFDYLKRNYYEKVEDSGGVALPLPNTKKPALVDRYLDLVDGLLISGGNEVWGLGYIGIEKVPGDVGGVGGLSIGEEGHFGGIRGEDVEVWGQPCCLGGVHRAGIGNQERPFAAPVDGFAEPPHQSHIGKAIV